MALSRTVSAALEREEISLLKAMVELVSLLDEKTLI